MELKLLMGADAWHTAAPEGLGLEPVRLADGPHGLRVEVTGADGKTGSHPNTAFPTAATLASTWDTALVKRVGEALGKEAGALGVDVLLGPGINLKRTPLCGRNFEYFSEDPVLTGHLATAYVQGVQSQGVGACLKHFAANNQEFDRSHVSSVVDERTLRELYLKAFQMAVREAGPWTIMAAYNKLNGPWCTENSWLLDTVLRQEWGFDGVVVSDWGAVHNPVAAVEAGTDLEMPPNPEHLALLEQALEQGTLSPGAVHRNSGRVADLARKAAAHRGLRTTTVDWEAHHRLAQEAASEGIVLLKNEGGVLPVTPEKVAKIAVIGEFGRTPVIQGGGSSGVHARRVDSPLEEMRKILPPGVELEFAHAYLNWHTVPGIDQMGEALSLAARVDQVLLFVGNTEKLEAEGFDRTTLHLHRHQELLIQAVAAKNPNTVVVVQSGSAVDVGGWEFRVPAIVWTGFAGGGGGWAIARILFGLVNPSGHLAETFPASLEDTPCYASYPGDGYTAPYHEGLSLGYRHYDLLKREVSYPFGHGLSYSTFQFSGLNVLPAMQPNSWTVKFRVRNASGPAGKVSVQLYVRRPESRITRPPQELKAFQKVSLLPNEETEVEFHLTEQDLCHWDVNHHSWKLEPGTVVFRIGPSSRNLPLEASTFLLENPS